MAYGVVEEESEGTSNEEEVMSSEAMAGIRGSEKWAVNSKRPRGSLRTPRSYVIVEYFGFLLVQETASYGAKLGDLDRFYFPIQSPDRSFQWPFPFAHLKQAIDQERNRCLPGLELIQYRCKYLMLLVTTVNLLGVSD